MNQALRFVFRSLLMGEIGFDRTAVGDLLEKNSRFKHEVERGRRLRQA
jgi:hypothetical protein